MSLSVEIAVEIARASRDETESRDLREGPPADNSPLSSQSRQRRSRLSSDAGHGGLKGWGRSRDSVALADVIQDAAPSGCCESEDAPWTFREPPDPPVR